jgi:hypothetical protein
MVNQGLRTALFNSNCFAMQQSCAMFAPMSLRATLALGVASLLLAGCHKEPISSFSEPKANSAPPSSNLAMASPSTPSSVQWKVPAGWEEQPASGMRVGSFSVNQDGKHADVSIIPLGRMAGGDLANVNRWRGQVGLPPIDEAKLGQAGEPVTIGNTPAKLYDIAGTDLQTKQPTRILASMLSRDGATWFFKMTGPEDLVAKEKPRFKELLQSIQFKTAEAGNQPPAPLQLMSAAGNAMASMSNMLPPSQLSAEKPAWEVPNGWRAEAGSSIRVASFAVTGENGAKADVSVIQLAGTGGGLLANVNRWRSQIGLQPVDQAGLDKLISHHDVKGTQIIVVDMAGAGNSGANTRMLAAIVPRSGVTWFYKMLGSDQLVAQQRSAFIQFVQSARYPNAA